MLLQNCNIVFLDRIEKGSLLIENDVIKEINPLEISPLEALNVLVELKEIKAKQNS